MSDYYDSIIKYRDNLLAKTTGYGKYREMDDMYANEIRSLWEIVELKEVKKISKKEELQPLEATHVVKIMSQYGVPRRNLCTQFKLERKLQTISFNKKYNNPKYNWILFAENDLTPLFTDDLTWSVKDESNYVLVISGVPNSGKSEGTQTIAKFNEYQFKKILNKVIETIMSFSLAAFYDEVEYMEIGNMGVLDEVPKMTGKGSRLAEWHLSNLTRMIRAAQNSFIFTDAKEYKPDVVAFYLETAGKYKKQRITRYIIYDKDHLPLGHVYIPLHDDEEFRKEYKRVKMINIKKVRKYRGKNEIDIKDTAKTRKRETRMEELEKIELKKYKCSFTEADVFGKIRENKRRKWKDVNRDIRIFKERRKGSIIKAISEEYELSVPRINDIIKKVESSYNHYSGHMFENDFEGYLNSLKIYTSVKKLGEVGESDFICEKGDDEFHIFALKNINIKKNGYHVDKNTIKREILTALKESVDYDIVRLFTVIHNNTNKKTYQDEINYKNPRSIHKTYY